MHYGLRGSGSRQARYHFVVCGTAMTSSRCCSHQLPEHNKKPSHKDWQVSWVFAYGEDFSLSLTQASLRRLPLKCEPAHLLASACSGSQAIRSITKNRVTRTRFFVMVGEAGFGPAKSVTTDLQSAPFGRSGIPP